MTRRLAAVLAAVLAAALVPVGLAPAPAGASSVTPTLNLGVVATGLSNPWDVGFLPNGRMLVTERPGRFSRVDGGTVTPLAIPGDVVASGEGGMLGLAVDPRFSSNGYVFVCMTSNRGGSPDVRVVRFRLNQAGTQVLGRTDVVTGMPYSTGRHSGCRPRFGPDGHLWVGTGDAAIGTTPQDPSSLGGKVLRVTRSGAAAPGNPGGRRWFTSGHRNVQGLAFRGLQAFAVEHGPDRDDEINRLVAGGNYGWDPVPGYNESVPMTDLAKFPNARPAIWRSGSERIAPSGAAILAGARWGAWRDALAVATLRGQSLQIFRIDAAGNSVGQRIVAITGQGRLRSPVLGPDGNLYITTDAGAGAGRILRVVPTGAQSAAGFPDVPCGAYFARPVQFLVDERITTGVGTTGRFLPGTAVDRGQLATFLWRLEGRPSAPNATRFVDVPSGAYFARPVGWLDARRLTTGVDGTNRFQPRRAVTRAEMVTFLWRLAGRPTGFGGAGFPDVPAGAYFAPAVRWAAATGVTTGLGTTGRFGPREVVTRGQAAAFLHRFAGSPAVPVRGC